MDVETFRQHLPEFGDSVQFPDSTVSRWIDVAVLQLRPEAWGQMLEFGIELFVAHNLVIQQKARKSFGTLEGPTSSKTIGPVSVSRDVSSVTFADAGLYNSTSYGVQFWQMARMAGMGGAQLTGATQGFADTTNDGGLAYAVIP